MKNILVPTDFSTESHHAFKAALQLAQRAGGNVTLLHVLAIPSAQHSANFSSFGGPVNGAELPNSQGIDRIFAIKLLQVTKQRMHQLLEEAATLAPGVPVQDITDQLEVDEAILKVIEERRIDLVVIGSQHHDGLEQLLAASNTEQLVRLAPCPVLAVKQSTDLSQVRDIVFPSDFSAEADHAVTDLRQIQQLFPEAQLHLLHVTADEPAHAQQQMADFANRHQLANALPVVFEGDSVSQGIEEFAEQVRAGLIVIPTHARNGFSRLFQSSVAEKVANQSTMPVLTFHL